ncbi:MAG: tobe domain protein [Aquificae bacterium]|nr:tobe domain protein [Aquificota bacterium]
MNKIKGFISKIETSGNISIVEIDVDHEKLFSIIIGDREDFLKLGKEVFVIFKETEVSIAKNFSGEISLKNQFKCKISDINMGKLLTQVTLTWNNNTIKSIITTSSAKRLDLKIEDQVTAFVKTNEISIMEI